MNRLTRTFLHGLACLLVLGVAGCQTTPERINELEQARAAVQELESQPKAATAASSELAEAREALDRAEASLEDGEPIEQVRHEAYLARRHAEIGTAVAQEAAAIEAIRRAEAERNEVQLEARTREADRAERLAQQRGAQAERSARQAEAAIQEASRLAAELEEMEAEQTERGLVLTLGDVLFDTASADLKEGAAVTLDRLAEFLDNNPERRLLVEGHTDSRGPEDYNQELSAERAQAVADALAQRGISRDRLRPVGLGEAYPVASNDSPGGLQQNRRVEVVISSPDGSFPPSAEQRTVAARKN